MWGFFPHQPVLQRLFNSDAVYLELMWTLRRLRAHSLMRCPSFQMPVAGLACHLSFWPTRQIRFLWPPPIRFVNLAEWLRGLRKGLLARLWGAIKECDSGTARWKGRIGQSPWEGAQSFPTLPGCFTLLAPQWFTSAEALWTFWLGFLWKLQYIGMIE